MCTLHNLRSGVLKFKGCYKGVLQSDVLIYVQGSLHAKAQGFLHQKDLTFRGITSRGSYVPAFLRSEVLTSKSSYVLEFIRSGVHMFLNSYTPGFVNPGVLTLRGSDIQGFLHPLLHPGVFGPGVFHQGVLHPGVL